MKAKENLILEGFCGTLKNSQVVSCQTHVLGVERPEKDSGATILLRTTQVWKGVSHA